MPYNTRRKSLSLPSLGIQLPNSSRARRSPSLPKPSSATTTSTTTSTTSSSSTSTSSPSVTIIQPPPKKMKRSHASDPLSLSSASIPRRSGGKAAPDTMHSSPLKPSLVDRQTPPPSPVDSTTASKIDTDGINDDIVVAVIQQLEKTGNRPHLIKELATVLSTTTESIANSANAAALISSRLSVYLKRPWTALAPCPIAKELIPVHPRKVFFYLTNSPHQPLNQNSNDITLPKDITPSLSGASVETDDDSVEDLEEMLANRERARLSPSPEVDLSNPEFDQEEGTESNHDLDLAAGFSLRNPPLAQNPLLSHAHRAASPRLEGDEREFTLTASLVRERASGEDTLAMGEPVEPSEHESPMECDDPSLDLDSTYLAQENNHESSVDYPDYFSSNPTLTEPELTLYPAAEVEGASPSPSASSELSSISSLTSGTSDGETDEEGGMHQRRATTCKRTWSMANIEPDMPCKSLKSMSSFGIATDPDMDYWVDFRNPESVEIEELDAIFGDI
ncbi:hypothetical protein FQN57_000038 [Myotisia sp. PD_48]|nr:hypothetical protein FQN57_000038 [Myotisia sp. PD_48]